MSEKRLVFVPSFLSSLMPKTWVQPTGKDAKSTCKRCKAEFEKKDYPVCDYCLKLLDNWE